MDQDRKPKDYLWLNLQDLPYFRALLRAVEARFYQEIQLSVPILDLGCGDGHFASVAFDRVIDVGVDPLWKPLLEAQRRCSYQDLLQSDGSRLPFPEGHFASVISNSVLEHIPRVEPVLIEIARVLRPGGTFVFCVPNHKFLQKLSIGLWLDKVRLVSFGNRYRAFFNLISRHYHCDPPDVWEARLERAGFILRKWWYYFSPTALRVMEWGHYFGLPSLIAKIITGRWIISPSRLNLGLIHHFVKPYYEEPVANKEGVYSFYIATRG
jgi:SAM-dependent methyltransferase